MEAVAVDTGFGVVFVEVERSDVVIIGSSDGELEGVEDKARELAEKFDRISETIVSTCRGLHAKVFSRLGEVKPTEFEVEFSITLGGELGVPLVTKGTAEAMFKVRACW